MRNLNTTHGAVDPKILGPMLETANLCELILHAPLAQREAVRRGLRFCTAEWLPWLRRSVPQLKGDWRRTMVRKRIEQLAGQAADQREAARDAGEIEQGED